MKKVLSHLIAISIIFGAFACSKDKIASINSDQPVARVLTCSFDINDDSKTAINEENKTVWSSGDKIWVSNGTSSDTLTVADSYDGKKYCEFQTLLSGTLYIVYPLQAAIGINDGKFLLDVPKVQDGSFGSAHICVAIAKENKVKMKNVTSILQFSIPEGTKPIKAVSVNAIGNAISGNLTVDLSSGEPNVASSITSTNTIVRTNGHTGKFYLATIPGTYNAGFSLTAISSELMDACQIKKSAIANTLNINEISDLGTIGDNLHPIKGDGTSSSPWQISNLAEMVAFTYFVNLGNSMQDRYIKVVNDIDGISVPIGTYDEGYQNYHPFKGNFDGGDKTLTLSISQTAKCAAGLFGNVADSAKIYNVKVAGYVTSSYSYAGALAGVVKPDKTTLTIENCSSSATVTGTNIAGGLIGFATGNVQKAISNCTNEGLVLAETTSGGVCGYSFHSDFYNDANKGTVTTTADNGGVYIATKAIDGKFTDGNWENGTGGVVGWAQNSTVKDCRNSGDVTAVNKVGGVVGSAYYTDINHANNTGKVTCTSGILGGVVGWILTYGNLFNSTNSGVVYGADKSGWVGGVLGYASPQAYEPHPITIARCTNKGKVSATGSNVGGIVGNSYSMTLNYNGKTYGNRTMIYDCANEGEVTSTGDYVGGIYGYTKDWGSWTVPVISGCANNGNITGNNYVSGIVGYIDGYYSSIMFFIYNCENHGNILTTRTDDAGEFAGGIIGAFTKVCSSSTGVRLRNCLNDGKIQYLDASHIKVNMGGIAGYLSSRQVSYNCFNGGTVGPVSGNIASGAEATLGALIGNCAATLTNSYYLNTTSANAVGTSSSIKAGDTVIFSDASGRLSKNNIIDAVAYSTVIEALNARAAELYGWKWDTKPSFIHPSYSDPISSGDYDFGYGDQI